MSHHLDSPIARQDIRLDITDSMYFAVKTVRCSRSTCATRSPAQFLRPAFTRKACTNSRSTSMATPSKSSPIASRSTRGTPTENSASSCGRIAGAEAVDPHAAGDLWRKAARTSTSSRPPALRIWAGKAGDPFWIEPDVLHAVGHAFEDGTAIDLSGWNPHQAKNLFAGHTVYSIVLEVPDDVLLSGTSDSRRIGVWAVATLATDAGGWRSINRVGLPMIHPLFTQYNEDLGNRLNAGRPADDFRAYGTVVAKAIAGVVSANGTTENPRTYGENVAHRFFPNVLPYEVGTPAIFGFAAWNGRSLTDNAPDVMFSIAANAPVRLGIGRESVTSKPSATFPYVPAA